MTTTTTQTTDLAIKDGRLLVKGAPNEPRGILRQGESLMTGDRLVSGNGRSFLINRGDNKMCLYSQLGDHTSPIWSISDAPGPAYLIMQGDGNLVYYTQYDNKPHWDSRSENSGHPGPYQLIMQGDGNLVIYAGDGHSIWDTSTQAFPAVSFSSIKFRNNAAVVAFPVIGDRTADNNLWYSKKYGYSWHLDINSDETADLNTKKIDTEKGSMTIGQWVAGGDAYPIPCSLGFQVEGAGIRWMDPYRRPFSYDPGCGKTVTITLNGTVQNSSVSYDGIQVA